MSFSFSGDLDISKSWLNRALILQSYQPEIQIIGDSSSDDVQLLKKCLSDFADEKSEFYVGLGGTTFRFLALRVSRKPGLYKIKGEKRLFDRPQKELVQILAQVGVKSFFNNQNEFVIESNGWVSSEKVLTLHVDAQDSSQFMTSVLLNAVDLPFDLQVKVSASFASESYFKYTLQMMTAYGFGYSNGLVKAYQKLTATRLVGEVDVSSFFSLAAAGVLAGQVCLTNWNQKSLQPDMKFVSFFKDMGLDFIVEASTFKIAEQKNYKSLTANLENCPDLFPVLAVLCAFAQGKSHLFGAHQLIHKESDRITKTVELLSRCGFQVEKMTDGLKIVGDADLICPKKDLIYFDPEHDHRMAFAAYLLQLKGFPVRLTDHHVIAKSYPQFAQHIGLEPHL